MAASFRERALACVPQHETMKPSRFWVGILFHNLQPEEELDEGDFLWIKANGKITVQTIHTQYTSKRPVNIELKLGDETPAFTLSMSQINHFSDNIIIFRAVERSATPPRTNSAQFISSKLSTLPSEEDMALSSISTVSPTPDKLNINELPQSVQTRDRELSAVPNISYGVDFPITTDLGTPQSAEQSSLLPLLPFDSISSTGDWNNQDAVTPNHVGTPYAVDPRQPSAESANIPLVLTEASVSTSSAIPYQEFSLYRLEGTTQLEELLKENSGYSVEALEAGLGKGMVLLDELKARLSNHSSASQDAGDWIKQISDLKIKAEPGKTVIGVVGDTGAGKSSVINALLDEERLVPTNCMRACTAVVTEISYNGGTADSDKYLAEIEFIKPEDWEKELTVLFRDLFDQSGTISRESQQPDSEAGIAYAKIKAIYPEKTKDELATIAESGWKRLLKDPCVQSVLGTTKQITASSSEDFYNRLQRYVDSQEKPIKGVHDSNAARAAVCEGYMKQCNALWIVAPIIRAVDNKAAKELLGASFKRQLKYDGTYGNITFICSKTDDISTSEAYHAFNLDEVLSESYDRATQLEQQIQDAQSDLDEYRNTQRDYGVTFEAIDEQLERWESRRTALKDGEIVYPSPLKDKKRKRKFGSAKQSRGSPKKVRANYDSDNEWIDDGCEISSDYETSASESDYEGGVGYPLTKTQIDDKLSELRDMKKEARKQRQELGKKVSEARQKVNDLKEAKFKDESEVRIACIAERNRRSKGAIQQDFASGIKELDQENAAEEDEANFNPDEDVRDYDEVARTLPVFCISSRAYQKLSGRLKKDPMVAGFTELDQTEVPQLKRHCIKLTEPNRADGCRKFLNTLNQLLNSLSLWSSDDGSGRKFSETERDIEQRALEEQLQGLSKALLQRANECVVLIRTLLSEKIFGRFTAAINASVRCAVSTAERWGTNPNHDDRSRCGFSWATYKALCRRMGVFTNATGRHDWNDQLAEPMLKVLMSSWEKTFQHRLPHALKEFVRAASVVLSNFHSNVVHRVCDSGAPLPAIGTLAQQLRTYETSFREIANRSTAIISEQQKSANRQFNPIVAAALEVAYDQCANESGQGSFRRMKDAMEQHVENHKDQMFSNATSEVRRELDTMCINIERQLKEGVGNVYMSISRDYAQLVRCSPTAMTNTSPECELEMKKKISEIVALSRHRWDDVLQTPDGAPVPVNGFNDLVVDSKENTRDQLDNCTDGLKANISRNGSEQPGHCHGLTELETTVVPLQMEQEEQQGETEMPPKSLEIGMKTSDDGIDWSNDVTMVEDEMNGDVKLADVIDGLEKPPAIGKDSKAEGIDMGSAENRVEEGLLQKHEHYMIDSAQVDNLTA